jgi:hypothetical protein
VILAPPHLQINTTFRVYPSSAELEAVQPDFLYGAFSSAFSVYSINYTAWQGLQGKECQLPFNSSDGGALLGNLTVLPAAVCAVALRCMKHVAPLSRCCR